MIAAERNGARADREKPRIRLIARRASAGEHLAHLEIPRVRVAALDANVDAELVQVFALGLQSASRMAVGASAGPR